MNWHYPPYALFLFVAAAVSIMLALYAWQRRITPGATIFAILMLAVAEMVAGYGMHLISANQAAKIFWAQMQYFGLVTIPVAWLAFALSYSGLSKWLTWQTLALLSIIPVITLVFVWTKRWDRWIWASAVDYGPWFWVHMTYSYIILLIGTCLLIAKLINAPRLHRQQIGTLLIGVAVPLISNSLHIFGVSPISEVDLTPFAVTLTGIAFAWSLFRFRLLDITPVARDAIFENMYAGVIVLDTQQRIVDINPAAQHFFDCSPSEVIGRRLEEVKPSLVAILQQVASDDEIRANITLADDPDQRIFELNFSYLPDRAGNFAGSMAVLRDITEYERAEAQLRKSEARYRTVSELTSDFTYALSVDPSGNVDLEWITDAFFRMTDYTAEEVRALGSWRRLTHPDDRSMTETHIRRLYTGRADIAEFRIIAKSGEILWIRNYGQPQLDEEQRRVARILGAGQNITEQKRVEAALRESEERYRLLFDSNPNPMWVYDRQTLAFLAVNEAAVRIYGYTGQEFLAMKLTDLHPEAGIAALLEHTTQPDGTPPSTGIWQHRKKDGTIIDVEISSHALSFAGRSAQAILANDVTARRQAEAALRESEERYRRLVEYSPEPIAVHSEGNLVYVNAAGVKLYGAETREELIGKPIHEFIHPDYREMALIRDRNIHEEDNPADLIEEKIVRLNGQSIDVEIATIPITYLGKPALQVVTRDITARKRVEEALREQNEYFAALHDTMLAVMNRLDLADVLEAIVVRAGALVGTEHGYLYSGEPENDTCEIKVGVGVFRSYVGYRLQAGVGVDGIVWVTGQPLAVNTYQQWTGHITNDSPRNLQAVVGVPLTSGPHVVGVLGLVHLEPGRTFGDEEIAILTRFAELASIGLDNARLYTTAQQELAERKRAEEKLALARDQALEAARLKSEFLATMSHELRTPLNAIIGFTDLTLEQHTGPLNEQQRSNLQRVSRNARNLLDLIDGILDLSKIDAGRMQILNEPVRVYEVVSSAVSNIETLVSNKHLEVTIEQTAPSMPLVYGDSGRLRQIALNLLSNAVKFTPPYGRIIVALEFGPPTALTRAAPPMDRLPTGDWIALSVKDTGIGIAPEEHGRIWSEFYQIDGSTTRQYGGTGLGLTIVSRLTQLMGGRVGLHSVVGEGSTFTIWLPVAQAESSAGPAQSDTPSPAEMPGAK